MEYKEIFDELTNALEEIWDYEEEIVFKGFLHLECYPMGMEEDDCDESWILAYYENEKDCPPEKLIEGQKPGVTDYTYNCFDWDSDDVKYPADIAVEIMSDFDLEAVFKDK